jgi:hypothetical protein
MSAVDDFTAHAFARAYLVSQGEMLLGDAVDKLQEHAESSGLVDSIGQDAVQELLNGAFACLQILSGNFTRMVFGKIPQTTQSKSARPKDEQRPTPKCTIEAVMWCVRERGPNALQEPDNVARLRQCDDAALAQINDRMKRLRARAA